MILSARLIQHTRTTRYCGHCGRPIWPGERVLRLYGMADLGDKPYPLYFHPQIEEVDELRACAPDHPKVRTALSAQTAAHRQRDGGEQ
jgi:hypothetical protein